MVISLAIGFIIVMLGFFSMMYNMAEFNDRNVKISFAVCCVGVLYLVILLMVVMINGK
ncbi:hypothetical protein [Megamonas funiformis]|uniref:hypothetical protein n=1 Tax=Megamonas funiformis TaxID=437897 RepID=UPI003F7F481C